MRDIQIDQNAQQLGESTSLLVVHEAGPCGQTLTAEILIQGYHYEVIALAKVTPGTGVRVKTDRHDTLQMANLLLAGALVPVVDPGICGAAIWNLSRELIAANSGDDTFFADDPSSYR